MRRLLVALAAMAAILAPALPAHARAGFWAVTELDPLPAEVRPDVSYTVGFWVLQHGTHPYEGPGGLEPVGLRLTGEDGTALTFDGTPLPEPAHYATSIKVPAGRWRVQGLQGMFAPYEIGTLTVPGGLKAAPPQFPVPAGTEVMDYWGPVKPPGFPWKAAAVIPNRLPTATPAASAQPARTTKPDRATQPAKVSAAGGDSSPWRQPYALVAVAVAAVAGTLLVQRAARTAVRRRPHDPPEREAREGEEVISRG
ncbi:hypothetical protein [Microbispora sp. GKU 823]|uniref:hypothetical protein n=1 Tax=Microbispora sp. GKU 823 TaxID=1652100 RepID=UPI0009CD64B9|nr:hypothetical protein [Microbispora sp. GKU 823]OPG06630.1 hypothetical protein B1L11_32420 [Microbispora sp. GKU 823]